MRAIDGDALKKYFFLPYSNEESYSNIDIARIISDQPTINSFAQEELTNDRMTFPDTVEEFMDYYKIVDGAGILTSQGTELVPIFRMKQWFEHETPHGKESELEAKCRELDSHIRFLEKQNEYLHGQIKALVFAVKCCSVSGNEVQYEIY